MSQIHAITRRALDTDNVLCILSVPREVIDRLNTAEDRLGEQDGAKYRDRVLQVLAAMMLQSIDEFRKTDLCEVSVVKREGESPTIEGQADGDKASG